MNAHDITTVEAVLQDLKNGKMIILTDDENRENEGDLVICSDFITPDAINFMATYARGLICLTLTEDHCKRLNLPLMTANNQSSHHTNFTLSIEAKEGVTTGISAADRAKTIRVASRPNAKASDIASPGHIFPLKAVAGGVLNRAGHTEAGCDLADMATGNASAVICEIMNTDGTMARMPDLQRFAKEHQLNITSIAKLIEYRAQNETLIKREKTLPMHYGGDTFTGHIYKNSIDNSCHLALTKGDVSECVVRVHEPIQALDWFESELSQHSWSLKKTFDYIKNQPNAVVLLMNYNQSYNALEQDDSGNTKPLKHYGIGAQILKDLGVKTMSLMSHERALPSMGGFNLTIKEFIKP